jgi:hypothetical protein
MDAEFFRARGRLLARLPMIWLAAACLLALSCCWVPLRWPVYLAGSVLSVLQFALVRRDFYVRGSVYSGLMVVPWVFTNLILDTLSLSSRDHTVRFIELMQLMLISFCGAWGLMILSRRKLQESVDDVLAALSAERISD